MYEAFGGCSLCLLTVEMSRGPVGGPSHIPFLVQCMAIEVQWGNAEVRYICHCLLSLCVHCYSSCLFKCAL